MKIINFMFCLSLNPLFTNYYSTKFEFGTLHGTASPIFYIIEPNIVLASSIKLFSILKLNYALILCTKLRSIIPFHLCHIYGGYIHADLIREVVKLLFCFLAFLLVILSLSTTTTKIGKKNSFLI